MQAIRTIQKPTSEALTIQIPEAFINQELEIIILLTPQGSTSQMEGNKKYNNAAEFEEVYLSGKHEVQEHSERYLAAQPFKGDALFPEFPTEDLNVYEQ